MKRFIALIFILATQPVFALTGIIESKIIGTKTVQLELASIKTVPSAVSVDVHVDHDNQEMACVQSVMFRGFAQASFSMNGFITREDMSLVVPVSYESITDESQCKTAKVAPIGPVQSSLWKVLNPHFVISQAHEDDVLKQTMLVLASASQVVSVDLVNVSPDLYVLTNVKFNSSIPMNFYVIKAWPGSVSYLEHGTVTFR